MRFAYADPPYLGRGERFYGDATYDDPAAHAALLGSLAAFDGWVYHLSAPTLATLLPLAPPCRVLAWVKPFAAWKRGHYPAYAWEPVLLGGGRARYGESETPRDYLAEPMAMGRGLRGAKPAAVCRWLFDCLGAEPDDELVDIFPGTRAVSRAWEAFRAEPRLPFPSSLDQLPLQSDSPAG